MATYLVTIPEVSGLSRGDIADYILNEVKAGAGQYCPGDPLYNLTEVRDQITVKILSGRSAVRYNQQAAAE